MLRRRVPSLSRACVRAQDSQCAQCDIKGLREDDTRQRPQSSTVTAKREHNTRAVRRVESAGRCSRCCMPLRGGATLSLPPALLPCVTDSAWFAGPVLVDEDAALSALELAYEEQVRAPGC